MANPTIPNPPYHGGCLCGAVRYTLNARPMALNACHCADCQKMTGATNLLTAIADATDGLGPPTALQAAVLQKLALATPQALVTWIYADITWASVLKSLSAHQMFHRTVRAGVSGSEALRFLLCDPQFPKSVEHNLTRISRSLLELPRYEQPMAACAAAQKLLVDADVNELAESGLHEYVDELQIGIGSLHEAITSTYFVRAPLPQTDASSTQRSMLASA